MIQLLMAKPSFQIEDEVEQWVEDRLIPGQSKSAWYRYAVKTVMVCDRKLDVLYEPYEYDKRQEFIEKAVKEKIERAQNTADKSHENLTGENGENR